jgi:hypothetical protein
LTSIEIDTETSPQATVTSPAATAPNTVSVRPHRSTTRTTLTRTFTETEIHFTLVKTTTTATLPCESWHPRAHGPPPHNSGHGGGQGGGHSKARRWMPSALQAGSAPQEPVAEEHVLMRRYDHLSGIYSGDGPLTTTLTPAPSVSTVTASMTTTITDVVPTVVTTTTMV